MSMAMIYTLNKTSPFPIFSQAMKNTGSFVKGAG